MILWYKQHAPDDAIQTLRVRLADVFSMLDSVARKARATGEVPPEVQVALAKHFFGADAQSPKKSKKVLKQDSIIDRHNESEAA